MSGVAAKTVLYRIISKESNVLIYITVLGPRVFGLDKLLGQK